MLRGEGPGQAEREGDWSEERFPGSLLCSVRQNFPFGQESAADLYRGLWTPRSSLWLQKPFPWREEALPHPRHSRTRLTKMLLVRQALRCSPGLLRQDPTLLHHLLRHLRILPRPWQGEGKWGSRGKQIKPRITLTGN